jgi:hypothetical protein
MECVDEWRGAGSGKKDEQAKKEQHDQNGQ